MLEIRNLTKSYGSIEALNGISLSVPEGKITIISGADGSGKSTLFKLILGLEPLDGGEIRFMGDDIGKDYSIITRICGYMPEKFSLYPDLSVEENLNFFSDIRGVPKKRREELKQRLLENTGMAKFKKRRANALSGGMKQKLALATILLSSPQIIILDEPTTGVDPLSRIEFFNIIESLKDEGKTILISTPYLDEAEKGDYIFFIKNGTRIQSGYIDALKRDIPFRLFTLTPDGNIFDIVAKLKQDPRYRDRVFIKGQFIKFIGEQSMQRDQLTSIPSKTIREEKPSLEDIYLYYEKLFGKEE